MDYRGMGIERHFLGWERPFSLLFSERLRSEAAGSSELDEWLVWVPSARAGRHVLNQLFRYEGEVEAFHPPRIITPARFIQGLAADPRVASETQCLLAWKTVLTRAEPHTLEPLIPFMPRENRQEWAYRLSEQLMSLRARLVEEQSSFTDVNQRRPDMEGSRWSCLAHLENQYHRELERLGRIDPDKWLHENLSDCFRHQPYKRLLIAGVLNLSKRQSHCVELFQNLCGQVDSYMPAPGDRASQFSEDGRPIPGTWDTEAIPGELLTDRIHRASEPRQLVDRILALSGDYRTDVDALVVGSTDKSDSAYLIECSRLTNSPFYAPEGKPFSETAWGRLIRLVTGVSAGGTLEDLSELLRHNLFRQWALESNLPVSRTERALAVLQNDNLMRVLSQLNDPGLAPNSEVGHVRAFIGAIQPVLPAVSPELSYPQAIWGILREIAGQVALAEPLQQVLAHLEEILQDLQGEIMETGIDKADQVRLLQYRLETGAHYPERDASERPVAGWLELPWECAPHLVLLGLPDTEVPGQRVTDTFLAPALCRQMGFYGSAETAAFHAFRLRLLLESRKQWGKLDILLPDRALNDDPVQPSRFLFLAKGDELRSRVEQLMGQLNDDTRPIPAKFGPRLRLPAAAELDKISVTAFRGYLRNPFAYYLENRLGWRPPAPVPLEMDPMMFGNLAHWVLEQLNGSSVGRDLVNSDDICGFLLDHLDQRVTNVYGSDLTVPLQIQRDSMKERLRAVAAVIGEQRQIGWFPLKVEWAFHKEIDFDLEGVPLRGKIDLLEKNEDTGAYRIIDYKTSEKNESPQATHLSMVRSGTALPVIAESDFPMGDKEYRWKDLQLPLYQEAIGRMIGETPLCGYICIGKAVKDICIHEWTPEAEHRKAATECASAIIREIRRGNFPLPAKLSPRDPWLPWFGDDFSTNVEAGFFEATREMVP